MNDRTVDPPALVIAMVLPLLLLLPSATGFTKEISAEANAIDWLPSRQELEHLLEVFDVPGIALVGLNKCQVAQEMFVGYAEIEPERRVAENTVFEVASLSKPVFAYLVMRLVDEGIVNLDDKLIDALESDRIADKAEYAKLTPRIILSHQSGLPNWAGDSSKPARSNALVFQSKPGTSYSYSGEAYELLLQYVERKTGKSLSALFEHYLSDTMPLSTFVPPVSKEAFPARGYVTRSSDALGRGLENLRQTGGAAGGLVSSAKDYGQFVASVCAGQGLSARAYSEMLTEHTTVDTGEYVLPTWWGLGWGIMQVGPEKVIFHGGNNGEFRSFAAFFPATREGVVILTNGNNGSDLIDALIEQMQ